MSRTILIASFCIASLGLGAALVSLLGMSEAAFWLLTCLSMGAIILIKKILHYYNSLTFLFFIFFVLYGLSGPAAALYGTGIPTVFSKPYLVDEFLLGYALALSGFCIGVATAAMGYLRISHQRLPNSPWYLPSKLTWHYEAKPLIYMGWFFAVLATGMELVNLWRGGGVNALLLGKAYYQGVVSDLLGTLPSGELLQLSAASLSLGIASSIRNIKRHRLPLSVFGVWLLCSLPLLTFYVILGERSILLVVVVILLLGTFYLRVIHHVPRRIWMGTVILYVLAALLYGVRGELGWVLQTGDTQILRARLMTGEFWAQVLNPAHNEFGAPFGNFNTYRLLAREEPLYWGTTYLVGLTTFIPRFVWPDKPISITYEFRNRFFSEWEQRSAIAGTAFSSILEAFMNFGYLGIAPIYALIGVLLTALEGYRIRSTSLWGAFFYLLLAEFVIRFHRSSLGFPIFWPMILASIGTMAYWFVISFFTYSVPKRIQYGS